MKIIKPSVEYLGIVPTDYVGALKFIEAAGRTCYKSEDKITGTSAEPFVKRLIKAGHLAMVEHSSFVVRHEDVFDGEVPTWKYLNVVCKDGFVYIGGNLTAWFQQVMKAPVYRPFVEVYGLLFDLPIFSKTYGNRWQVCPHNEIPAALHRYSVRFICDRGVSHELVRHRPTAMDWWSEYVDLIVPTVKHKFVDLSAAQESTRYVNYGGKDMEFIEPEGFEGWSERAKDILATSCADAMENYHQLIYNNGLKPQQARAVLPNALKTEVVVTCDAVEWAHIKSLRTAKDAHPDMQRVMSLVPWEEMRI